LPKDFLYKLPVHEIYRIHKENIEPRQCCYHEHVLRVLQDIIDPTGYGS
jgi:hypothetical protein